MLPLKRRLNAMQRNAAHQRADAAQLRGELLHLRKDGGLGGGRAHGRVVRSASQAAGAAQLQQRNLRGAEIGLQ